MSEHNVRFILCTIAAIVLAVAIAFLITSTTSADDGKPTVLDSGIAVTDRVTREIERGGRSVIHRSLTILQIRQARALARRSGCTTAKKSLNIALRKYKAKRYADATSFTRRAQRQLNACNTYHR